MYLYTLQVGLREGNYTDSGLTEEEMRSRIAAFFKDEESVVLHVTKYEVP